MNTVKDLRQALSDEVKRLQPPAGLETRVLQQALPRTASVVTGHRGERYRAFRSRFPALTPRTTNWAAVAAAVLAVAIVAGLLAAGTLRNLRSTPVTPNVTPKPTLVTPTPPAAPRAASNAYDLDVVDANTGWVLLDRCAATCAYLVSGTTDGGSTWSKPVQVGPTYPSTDGDAPRKIHFLDPTHGFVYGHEVAYFTADGGRTWKTTSFRSEVVEIEGRGSNAWVVELPCAKGVPCPYVIHRSSDGGLTWTIAASLPDRVQVEQTVAFGVAGLLIGNFVGGDLAITIDGGSSWTSIKAPCDASALADYVATSDGLNLWQLCTGNPGSVFVSRDGGATWHQQNVALDALLQPGDVLADIVSPSPGTAFVSVSMGPLLVSRDFGRTWHAIYSEGGAAAKGTGLGGIRFANPQVGWGRDYQGAIWATSDGGTTWSPLQTQP